MADDVVQKDTEATEKPDEKDESSEKSEAEEKVEEKPDDWRAVLTSEDSKKFAESSPDVEHLVNRALDMRRQLATAITPPGKDAKPEELTAHRKKIGVPEEASGYDIPRPEHLDEETFNSEPVQKILETFREQAHSLNVPKETFQAQVGTYWAMEKALVEAQKAEDQKFADESEAGLRKLWPGEEYDKNKDYMGRAAQAIFGNDLEEVRNLETKDGRFVLDHPVMLRGLAAIGREMEQGGLVPPLSDSERSEGKDQLIDLRKKISEAQSKGDSKEANRLYQEEQKILAKMGGSVPIVGAEGRAV